MQNKQHPTDTHASNMVFHAFAGQNIQHPADGHASNMVFTFHTTAIDNIVSSNVSEVDSCG